MSRRRPGTAPHGSRPRPVTIRSSARLTCPEGVANTRSCPAADSTCQLTATSVGSKSQAGNGMRTVTIAGADTSDERRDHPEHPSAAGVSVKVMSERETAGADVREPIFDAGDKLSEQWVKASQGEVLDEISETSP